MTASAASAFAPRREWLRTAQWLHPTRIAAWASILLIGELIALAFLIAGTHGLIVPLDHPVSTDFASFYAAGKLAVAGTPVLAYDQAAHYAAEQLATEPGIPYQFFFYPPPMLLLCMGFAALPYMVAFLAFQAATLALFLLVADNILQMPLRLWLPPLLALPPLLYTLGLGQNALLTAGLFGAGLLLVDRRPLLSGLCFGVLCYKPHLGLLIPVALLAGQHWRAAGAATLTLAAIVGLTLVLFGVPAWLAFLDAIRHSTSVYQSGRIEFAGMVSVFGTARTVGIAPATAFALQAVSAAIAAALVGWIWARPCSLPTRAAALLAGALLAAPMALIYDLMLAATAGIWLLRGAAMRGVLPWEKLLLVLAFVISCTSRSVGLSLGVPIGFGCAGILMALALLHAARERAGSA